METCESLTSIEKTDEHSRDIIDELMGNDKVNYGNTPITSTIATSACETIEIIKSTIEKLYEQIDGDKVNIDLITNSMLSVSPTPRNSYS